MNQWETIVVAVVTSGALSTLIGCIFKIIENNENKHDQQKLVNQEMLLWRIKDGGKKALAAGEITHEEFEDLTRVYALYKALGGNGFAEAVMAKVKALPLKENR